MTPSPGQVATEGILRLRLEGINQGYQDMKDFKNTRGIVVYPDADR